MGTIRRAARVAAAVAVLAALLAGPQPGAASAAPATGGSLRFGGTGTDRTDRVEIPLDDPARPVDVGAGAFTVEWWMRASATANDEGTATCGSTYGWITGHVLVDRDRWPVSGADGRDFGASVTAAGDLAFGAQGASGAATTVCTDLPGLGVLDGSWHHVALTRSAGGQLAVWVDGAPAASGAGPTGDLSYPDGVAGARATDPLLVLGAEKHDAGPAYPSYAGWMDEVRVSDVQRYAAPFVPAAAPFAPDADTVGLYHLDEGSGSAVHDSSGATGGPSHGLLRSTSGGLPARSLEQPFVAPRFLDVGFDHPFHDEVEALAEDGIVGGYADGTYRPAAPVSRQAMSAFLHRLAGEPATSGPPGFVDVGATHPFATAIAWMGEAGISTGWPDRTYRPAAPVSRGAMSAFLRRLTPDDGFVPPAERTFADVGPGHPFFEDVEWMAARAISTGYDDGSYRPGAAVSRGAMAAFLQRLRGLLGAA